SAERFGDDVVVGWDIQESYPDLRKLEVAYRGPDGGWLPVEASPQLSGSAKFHPNTLGPVTIRVRMTDLAGNTGEATRDVGGSSVASNPTPSAISPASNRVTLPVDKAIEPGPAVNPVPGVGETPAPRHEQPTGAPLAVSNPVSPPVNGPLPTA